ncbi:tetratricopeptide repeat protein [Sphingobacterium spiritivorum]|uniref:tetratricopeptide repeat protein n=1 Tax=Sphingobacterium spiritivorum TaxID=258 RepID=UPI003DA33FAD
MIKQLLLFFFVFTSFSLTAQNMLSLSAADSLYEEKEFTKALQAYEKLLLQDENNSYILCKTGLCQYELKDFQKAKEKFRLAALYCAPEDKENIALYYTNLSACFSNLQDNEKAYEYAIKAYSIMEDSGIQLWNAASMAQNLGKYDECLKIMDNAKVEKNNAFLTLYGRCYMAKKLYQQCIESYEQFLANYDANDDFVTLNAEDEKGRLVIAYAFRLTSPDLSEQEIDACIARLKELWISQSADEMARTNMLNSFFKDENICSIYSYSAIICHKLFSALVTDASPVEKMQFAYYTQKNYSDALEIARGLMNNTAHLSGEELQKVKAIRYFASLRLFIADYLRKGKQVDQEQLRALAVGFNDLFEKGKMYSDEEFQQGTTEFGYMQETFTCFQNSFKTKEEQREAAPILLQIIKDLPNVTARKELTEILSKGYIQN